ncbi:MAG: histidine kinase [Treponema sp.]|jgi:sensor histidine kinase YesM|nr:histidine kinase [Treponema sp.]
MKKASLKTQMILSAAVLCAAVILSNIYILFIFEQMQQITNARFSKEIELQSFQNELHELHDAALTYLSSRSSTALATMLVQQQSIKQKIQTLPPKQFKQSDLKEREIYSLVARYSEVTDAAVEAKRGRNISLYTSKYAEMNKLLSCIDSEINSISLDRFKEHIASYEIFIEETHKMNIWGLLFVLNITALALVSIWISTGKILKPLNILVESSQEIADGNFNSPDIPAGAWKEIDELISGFNRMKTDISTYIQEIEWKRGVEQEFLKERLNNMKMQQLMKRMELYTMQAQMNPHFLFNTLNTGVQLAILEGADNTAEYMTLLAKLFRHDLSQKNVIVPLRHESDGLEVYCEILRIRFPKTLTLNIDIPENLKDESLVPASILQPLVENSVVHGFNESKGYGTVNVTAKKENYMLHLCVEDDGCGISEEIKQKLLEKANLESTSSKVMGLENVIQRLYFFYPQNKKIIKIESAMHKGTKITISLNTLEEPCIQF